MDRNLLLDSPCPADSSHSRPANPIFSDDEDIFNNTAAVEFTTEIKAPVLTASKPRRAKRPTTFQIHEDIRPEEVSTTRTTAVKRKAGDGRSSMLAQPAQRFQRPRVSFAPPASQRIATAGPNLVEKTGGGESKNSVAGIHNPPNTSEPEKDALKRDVRRHTIYIPPEDTTVPTVFMGIFSPLKSHSSNLQSNPAEEEPLQIGTLEARIATKQRAKRTTTTSPLRQPLDQRTKPSQSSMISRDVPGKNGGKENIPPGLSADTAPNKSSDKSSKRESPAKLKTQFPSKGLSSSSNGRSSKPPPLHAKSANSPLLPKTIGHKASEMLNKHMNTERSKGTDIVKDGNLTKRKSAHPAQHRPLKPLIASTIAPRSQAQAKPSHPRRSKPILDQKYPLLTEDISNPILYEDNWLSHQEVVITQLINGLFDSASGNSERKSADELRLQLLKLYQDPSFVLLYKRLHASLLFGALAIPKEALSRSKRLRGDLARKRSFLNLWLDNYDLNALRAAAETVIGRRLTISPRASQNGSGNRPSDIVSGQKALRKAIEAFLDTFLLRNEDLEEAPSSGEEVCITSIEHSRTILRSILIVVLLDKARLCSTSSLPRCLFSSTSQYKSSKAVLQAVAVQLLPSIGDIIRPLGHLDCHVLYEQNPLQEYRFRIDNLAVDLRDGVLLTRMVELLLFSSARAAGRCRNETETVTLKMPEGEILVLNETENEWPLSQHLKFPCLSRSAKLFNVQIALTALQGAQAVGEIPQKVRAEEIVDGYREKTIALLWTLIGKWGLSSLIDWSDLRNEIDRLRSNVCPSPGNLADDEAPEDESLVKGNPDECTYLLKEWATVIAQRSGIYIKNLSTDFADGKIFESIVNEYEPFLIRPTVKDESTRPGEHKLAAANEQNGQFQANLKARLQNLGCSAEFASLVCPSTASRIFDSDFVLGALAFLCSRLVPAAKHTRAVLVLQRGWRTVLERRSCRLRLLARKVATQCAAVVRTRDRILWAKGVIIAWWRAQKELRELAGRKIPSAATAALSKSLHSRNLASKGNVARHHRIRRPPN